MQKPIISRCFVYPLSRSAELIAWYLRIKFIYNYFDVIYIAFNLYNALENMHSDFLEDLLSEDHCIFKDPPPPTSLNLESQNIGKPYLTPQYLSQIRSQTGRKRPGQSPAAQKPPKSRRNYNFWTAQQEQQLYYFSVDYMLKNPYFQISWTSRKQSSYYLDMEKHLEDKLGKNSSKTVVQCKIKELNLGKACKNSKKKRDLVDNALFQVNQMIKRGVGDPARIMRFELLIERYTHLKKEMEAPRPYEVDINKLLAYSKQTEADLKLLSDNLLQQ